MNLTPTFHSASLKKFLRWAGRLGAKSVWIAPHHKSRGVTGILDHVSGRAHVFDIGVRYSVRCLCIFQLVYFEICTDPTFTNRAIQKSPLYQMDILSCVLTAETR